jgi:hypothetical protein
MGQHVQRNSTQSGAANSATGSAAISFALIVE